MSTSRWFMYNYTFILANKSIILPVDCINHKVFV